MHHRAIQLSRWGTVGNDGTTTLSAFTAGYLYLRDLRIIASVRIISIRRVRIWALTRFTRRISIVITTVRVGRGICTASVISWWIANIPIPRNLNGVFTKARLSFPRGGVAIEGLRKDNGPYLCSFFWGLGLRRPDFVTYTSGDMACEVLCYQLIQDVLNWNCLRAEMCASG